MVRNTGSATPPAVGPAKNVLAATGATISVEPQVGAPVPPETSTWPEVPTGPTYKPSLPDHITAPGCIVRLRPVPPWSIGKMPSIWVWSDRSTDGWRWSERETVSAEPAEPEPVPVRGVLP